MTASNQPGATLVPKWLASVRVGFGALLLIDAVLEFQPGTYQIFNSLFYSNASVSPQPLRGLLVFAAQLTAHQPAVWNGILAALETALGVSIATGVLAEASLLACLPLFLGIWIFGQGVGLPFAQGTTDLNSGPVYLLLALVLLLGHSWRRLSLYAWARPGGHPLPGRLRLVTAVGLALTITLAALTWGSIATTESQPGQSTPPKVGGAVLAFDAQTGQDLLFGGCNYLTCSNRTWMWDGHRWLPATSRENPPPMGYASAAFDPSDDQVIMFGGATEQGLGPALSSTWAWNQGWRTLSPAAPPPGRRFPALAYDPASKQLVMFGGDDASGRPLSGTYLFQGGGWHRLSLPVQPQARTAAAMAFDPRLGELIMYGGSDEAGRLSDTWAWDGSGWSKLSSARSPGPLAYVGMATDPVNASVLLYAGAGAKTTTWEWGRQGWTPLRPRQSPPVYSFMSMAEAPAGRGVLLFGGATSYGSGFSAKTWMWNGSQWTEVS